MTTRTAGKRAGARRAAPRRSSGGGARLAVHAAGITLTLVAWGYLVSAAIDFGASARSGETSAWVFLGLAVLGAIGCLFGTLMLAARLLRVLGIGQTDPDAPKPPPRVPGGRRAAR